MAYYPRVPNMGYAQFLYPMQHCRVKKTHLAAAVLYKRAIFLPVKATVTEQSRKYLIYNYFMAHELYIKISADNKQRHINKPNRQTTSS